jgi:hypothetical protein
MSKWEYSEVTAPVREDGKSVHVQKLTCLDTPLEGADAFLLALSIRIYLAAEPKPRCLSQLPPVSRMVSMRNFIFEFDL